MANNPKDRAAAVARKRAWLVEAWHRDGQAFDRWFKQQKFSFGAMPNFTIIEHMRRSWCAGRAALTAEVERLRQEAQAYAESIDNVREVLGLEATHYLIIHDEVRDCIAALTADLAARGETIKGLEDEVAHWHSHYDSAMFNWNEALSELVTLRAQVIEERWQKNRAEFKAEHKLEPRSGSEFCPGCNRYNDGSLDPRHAYTPDDWRRDAREQLINEGVIKT